MNSHSLFQKARLAALLLACCGYAIAEPVTGTPAAQETAQSQTNVPAMPANQAATGSGDQEPVMPDSDAPVGSMVEDAENPDTGESAMDASGDPESAGTPEIPSAFTLAPASLHGQWTVREQHPEAGEVVTLFSINPDNSFAGTMTVAGNVVWSYSGNWYLDDNLITWFYTESTPPLMLVDETEVDEIISVDSEKLVYRSGKRDVLETLYRVSP
jgi:hypothetical protein